MNGKLIFLFFVSIILFLFKYYTLNDNDRSFSMKEIIPVYCEEQYLDFNELSEFLFHNVTVFCLIHTSPKYKTSRAIHQKATWLKRCNNYIYVSSEEDKELPSIKGGKVDGYKYTNERIRYGLKYVYENFGNKYDWFFKGDDDNYVIMENLRAFLLERNSSVDQYYGYKLTLGQEYMSGAGFILSKSALKKMVTIAFEDTSICNNKSDIPEDVEFGRCLKNINISAMDSRDMEDRHMFIPSSFEEFSSMIKNKHYDGFMNMSPYKMTKGYSALSKYPITFHYVKGDMFYGLEYIFYHASVIGKEQEVYRKPTKTKNNIKLSLIYFKEFVKHFYKF
uniref:N-acetylgalactosaminide beta-1,3-galactosyltransferase n=1 Tax=Parastrongyloides trichosuri TaxID=131310 RepID=A0A0N4ZSP6_PARTI